MRNKRKLFIAFFSFFCILSSGAQEKNYAEQQDTIFWSYVDPDESELYSLIGSECVPGNIYQKAIRIHGRQDGVIGYRIFGERIALPHKYDIDKLWIWMSHTLPSTPQEADIVCTEIDTDIIEEDIEKRYLTPFLKFDKEYYFLNDDIYMGYSFTIPEGQSCFAIISSDVGTSSQSDTDLINDTGKWEDLAWSVDRFAYIIAGLKEPESSDYIKGDVNFDDVINIVDVTRTVGYILDGNKKLMNIFAADMNSDGFVNIADVESITDEILEIHPVGALAETNNDVLRLYDDNGRMTLTLSSVSGYRAFQMDITVPEGCDINDITLNEKLNASHILDYRCTDNGKYRVLVRSKNGECFGVNNLLNFTNTAKDVKIDNIIFVTENASEKHFESMTGSDVTGINEINVENPEGRIYNVYGVRVSERDAQNGVFIINGKKVIK